MEQYLFPEEERAQLEKSRIPLAVYQYLDSRVATLIVSDGFCEQFGYKDHTDACYDMDHDMYRSVHPDDADRLTKSADRFVNGDGTYEEIYRTRIKSGSDFRIIHALGERIPAPSDIRLFLVWYVDEGLYSPLTEINGTGLSRSVSNSLWEDSALRANKYDYLTGLPSMTWFFEMGSVKLDAMQKNGGSPALVFLDFHGMKYFNRKHGFAKGDVLLQGFAQILADCFGNDNCCRLGQDHFAVIADEQGLEPTLEHIFAEAAALNGGLTLPVHAGIYLLRAEHVSISAASDRAKIACDAMRGRYSSCFNYYDLRMRDNEELRQYVIANLDTAIREKWIRVFYQPIVRAVSGKVCHEEALARWFDPGKGMLSPADFIPSLEDSGIIHKLDLFVVEQVLEKLKQQAADGLHLVPQSVNLSRADFDACDIVEEIRSRVDASGLPRKMIQIEVTESVIGKDFEFMKAQVERFQQLGFSVWMDDFGSGYSSLDVLESISFDMVKFDMHFMRKFNDGDSSKIILTQLVRMVSALNIDSVCEGVETAEQVAFLKDIGCAKLQGYYFCKPIPPEEILERNRKGIQIGYENPAEEDYFEAIGRANLFDMTLIAGEDVKSFRSFFDTLPISIMEHRDGMVRFIRSSASFRDYLERFYGVRVAETGTDFFPAPFRDDATGVEHFRRCCENRSRTFCAMKLPDGSTAHCTMRWIGSDPVTGIVAVALAVISVSPPNPGTDYANIARALAADYFNLFYVNLQAGDFIEYSSSVGKDNLAEERHGTDFFAAARQDARTVLYPEDQDTFVAAFTKENILLQLARQGVFTLTYRILKDGEPVYVAMKITRMDTDEKYLIVGVSSIDAQMKEKERLDRVRANEITYARIRAISAEIICMYTVDPVSGQYVEYSASSDYAGLGLSKDGVDFFADAQENGARLVLPADYPIYKAQMQKENVFREIREHGLLTFKYHLLIGGKPTEVRLRAGLVKESDGEKLIVGVAKAGR